MRVLVTGATGYVGQHVAKALRRSGHAVFGLTRDPTTPAAVRLTSAEIFPVRGDLREPHTYRTHLDRVDAVRALRSG